MRRMMGFSAAAVLSLAALAACGDDDDDDGDVAEANTEFCGDLAEYTRALANLAALSPTATKGEYEDAVEEVSSTREDMIDSAADLTRAEVETLQSEADALRDQLRDAPDDQAVQAILAEAQPQAAKVQTAAASVGNAICAAPGASSTTTGS